MQNVKLGGGGNDKNGAILPSRIENIITNCQYIVALRPAKFFNFALIPYDL